MFNKLRNRIARIIPFMAWIAKDLKAGNPEAAQAKVKAEVQETVTEVKTELKNVI